MVLALCLAAVGLTACTWQGDAAARWLASQSIVESVSQSGGFSGFVEDPSVAAVIRESATTTEIRQLATDASDYVRSHSEPGFMTIELSQHGLSTSVSESMDETMAAFDTWDLLRGDANIVSGWVHDDKAYLTSERDRIVELAAQYSSVPQLLSVSAPVNNTVSVRVYGCGLDGDGATLASALVDDESVFAASISLCTSTVLGTSQPEDLLPLAGRVRQLSQAAGLENPDIGIFYDTEQQHLLGNGAMWQISLAGFDEATERLLTRVYAMPTTLAALHSAEDTLRIVVKGDLRAAMTAVFSDPDLAAVKSVQLSGRSTIEASSLAEADSYLALVEQLQLLGDEVPLSVTPTAIDVRFSEEQYTVADGTRAIDLIVASGLSQGRDITVADYSYTGLLVVDGVAQPTDSAVGAELREYWLTVANSP